METRRAALSNRLESLLSSPQSSPRSSLDEDRTTHNDPAMHRTRSGAKLSNPSTSNTRPIYTLPSSSSPRLRLQKLPSSSSMPDQVPQKSPVPVLRWLGNWSYGHSHSRSFSDSHSGSASPSSSPSTPPSPSLSSLREALHETLPKLPPVARLPESFHASRALSRPPPFLDNLTRSTLPTSSLSPPHTTSTHPPLSNALESPPIVLTHSPPTRSSIDSLRSLSLRNYDRSIQTAAAAAPAPAPSRPASPTSRWWFQSENKENVDTLLNEDDRADTVQQEQDNIRNKYRSPKNPVIFCHGLLGFDSVTIGPSIAPVQVTHWRGIKEVLEANGAEVLITRVPATSSPVDRAKVLEEKISEVYPGRSVHLIGHSMGGLDCRYLTTHLTHRKFRVLSITTIATPHRGSSFADHFLSTVGRTRMPSVLSLLDLLPNGGGDGKAFESLTIESMRKFNEDTPDVEGVRYFSWGAVYEPGLIDTWKWPHSVILEKEGPNDGLVSVESSKWGTYLGTLSHVNHLDLVGWINTARYKWAEMMGKEIKFRPATFYLGIADMLAVDVEGQVKAGEQSGGHGEGGGNKGGVDGKVRARVGRGAEVQGGEYVGAGSSAEVPGEVPPEVKDKTQAEGENKAREQIIESLTDTGATVEHESSIRTRKQASSGDDADSDSPQPRL